LDIKQRFMRMLVFDSVLSLGGIAVAALMFLASLQQQADLTRQLYEHPYVVSNAARDLKMQILELRNRMLEMSIRGRSVAAARQDIHERRLRIQENLDLVEANFLGDKRAVARMRALIKDWEIDQEQSLSDFEHDHADAAIYRMGHGTQTLVDSLLLDNDYVINFARGRAIQFVSESENAQRRFSAWILGGALVITCAHLVLLWRRLLAKRELFDRLHALAVIDDLTGAKNRRAFLEEAQAELKRAQRMKHPLAIIAIDIDNFKKINDIHGHAAGDTVLRAFGISCGQQLRQIDTLGRIGGEEFAVLLPGSAVPAAAQVAERIRAAFQAAPFVVGSSKQTVTVSLGVAELQAHHHDAVHLLSDADHALYAAKHGGKNRVVVAGDTADQTDPAFTPVTG
jgi:diguanylate cyclase (GGDEF)-like protein